MLHASDTNVTNHALTLEGLQRIESTTGRKELINLGEARIVQKHRVQALHHSEKAKCVLHRHHDASVRESTVAAIVTVGRTVVANFGADQDPTTSLLR
mmetsp:Transcript_38134/g.81286  ORF Transcript_38134/g.81286 Transcript_38134/m.81286 type:complete len:98 (-) Transcript_38134:340-633(-)